MISSWLCPADAGGPPREELLIAFDRTRSARVLVLPAWFDEANKMRRFTLEVMRRLDRAGIDAFLPDLPGCNESLAPLEEQSLDGWRRAAEAAADACKASHVLAIRAGCLITPAALPGWHYAALSGPKLLRAMLRARSLAAREAGISETSEGLLEMGRSQGLVLGGWSIGAPMLRALETAEPAPGPAQRPVTQAMLGAGGGLWLRAEPDEDAAQADALAALIAQELAGDAA